MLRSFHFGPLFAAESDEGAGGKEEAPKALTEEDVGRIVNSAVTAQLKRALGPAVTEAIGGLKLEDQIGAAVEKLATKGKQPGTGDGATEDEGGGSSKVTAKDLQKQLTSLQEKLDASERKSQELERQRIEVEQRAQMNAALTDFRNGVQKHVRPELLEPFVDFFARGKGMLKVDDQGQPTLTVKRAPYKGAPPVDEDLPLPEAIPFLLALDDVKPFLPPPGGQREETKKSRAPGMRVQSNGVPDDPYTASVKALEEQGLLNELG